MTIVRRVGALLLSVAAAIVWFAAAPELTDVESFEDAVSAALSADELNNSMTEGAPQQSVVNGWTAKDLLVIQAEQNNELLEALSDPRPGLLILLGVLGIALIAFTSERSGPLRPSLPATSPPFASSGPMNP